MSAITSIMRVRKVEKRKRFSILSSCGNASLNRSREFPDLHEISSSSSDESAASDWLSSSCASSTESDSDEEPPAKRLVGSQDLSRPSYFVSTTSSVLEFVDVINKTSRCATVDCQGVLLPKRVESVGLGGGIRCWFSCSGCSERTVPFNSTVEVEHTRRTLVSMALQVATVLSGGGFASYQRLFGQLSASNLLFQPLPLPPSIQQ